MSKKKKKKMKVIYRDYDHLCDVCARVNGIEKLNK